MPQISKRVSPERRSEEEYCCRLSLCRAGSERSVSVLFVLLALIMHLSRENKQASISSVGAGMSGTHFLILGLGRNAHSDGDILWKLPRLGRTGACSTVDLGAAEGSIKMVSELWGSGLPRFAMFYLLAQTGCAWTITSCCMSEGDSVLIRSVGFKGR